MNKKVVGWIVAIVAVAGLAFLLTSRRQEGYKAETRESIHIGVILNLTGALAQADTPKQQVLEAALAYLKKKASPDDPIQAVELSVEDGKTDPKAGLAAYRKLYDSGIRIFITGSSFNAMSLFPLTEEAGCLLFGVSGHPDFGKDGNWSYRMYPRVETGVAQMKQILKEQGNPKVYIFHTDEPFGKSYASVLKEAYPNVIGEEPFQITQADFKDAIAKLESSGAGRVVIIGFGLGEKNLLRQMIERKVLIPVLGSEVFYYATLDLSRSAGTEGVASFFEQIRFLGPTLLNAILSNSGDDFIKFYEQRLGGAPQLFGVFAADSLVLLQEALRKTKGDTAPVALRDALSGIRQVKVFSGSAELLPSHELEYRLGFFGLDATGHAKALNSN